MAKTQSGGKTARAVMNGGRGSIPSGEKGRAEAQKALAVRSSKKPAMKMRAKARGKGGGGGG